MAFGYTYIERNITGRIENDSFTHFTSFDDCCTAAQKALDSGSAAGIVKIQIVPCEYDGEECLPVIMTVLKIIHRTPSVINAPDHVENRQSEG